jgi:hypothetical protein
MSCVHFLCLFFFAGLRRVVKAHPLAAMPWICCALQAQLHLRTVHGVRAREKRKKRVGERTLPGVHESGTPGRGQQRAAVRRYVRTRPAHPSPLTHDRRPTGTARESRASNTVGAEYASFASVIRGGCPVPSRSVPLRASRWTGRASSERATSQRPPSFFPSFFHHHGRYDALRATPGEVCKLRPPKCICKTQL